MADFKESDHPRAEDGKFSTVSANFKAGSSLPARRNNASEAVRALQASGHNARVWNGGSAEKSAAVFSHKDHHIYINQSHKFWADPERNSKAYGNSGHWSSTSPSHVLNHEAGHRIYDPVGEFSDPGHSSLAQQVSKYAAINPKEFVSEVHAGLVAGQEFPPEVMQAFKGYAKKRETGRNDAVCDCLGMLADSDEIVMDKLKCIADAVAQLANGARSLEERMDKRRSDASKEFHDLEAQFASKTANKALESGDHDMAKKWVDYGTEHAKQSEAKTERMEGPPDDKAKKDKKK